MSEAEQDGVTRLKQKIVEATTAHWKSSGRALLLANLGQQLTRDGFNLRTDLKGQKLVPFLESLMGDQVAVLTSPFDSLVRGIVPKGEEAGKDVHTLFSTPAERKDRINFDKRVWIAFSRTVPEKQVRVLQFEPEINFDDVSPEDAAAKKLPIVPAELIIPPESKPSSVRNPEMHKNIRSWLEKNGISIAQASAKASDSRPTFNDGNSLFSLMLATLDQKERERVSLPLDVVAKLLARKL